jgi:hypothetical protein
MNDIVNLKAVHANTTDSVYAETMCRHEAGAAILQTVGDSGYGWLRAKAREKWIEVFNKCKETGRDFNVLVARGAFEASLVTCETHMRSPVCPYSVGESAKLPRAHINAKSVLCAAIENGFNFMEDPEVSSGKLKDFNKAEKARKDKEAQQQALKEYAEAGGHIEEAKKPGEQEPGPAATPTATPMGIPAGKLSKEQLERIQALVDGYVALAEAGMSEQLDKLVGAATDQAKGRIGQALSKLGRKAA